MRWTLPIIALLAFAIVILLLREWSCGCECQEATTDPDSVPVLAHQDGTTFLM
jgi:hypothetical protein